MGFKVVFGDNAGSAVRLIAKAHQQKDKIAFQSFIQSTVAAGLGFLHQRLPLGLGRGFENKRLHAFPPPGDNRLIGR
jgi:hypothetical protein